ncbi:MAG: hypothetical protein MZU97_19835 [Bacillus subtilis]|nr:hypothetical protein [Bacillus subtilis]
MIQNAPQATYANEVAFACFGAFGRLRSTNAMGLSPYAFVKPYGTYQRTRRGHASSEPVGVDAAAKSLTTRRFRIARVIKFATRRAGTIGWPRCTENATISILIEVAGVTDWSSLSTSKRRNRRAGPRRSGVAPSSPDSDFAAALVPADARRRAQSNDPHRSFAKPALALERRR